MSRPKSAKMLQLINYRLRVHLQDRRVFVGTFMAFDKHMNLVLGDCEEHRTVRAKGKTPARIEKRSLGLLILKGDCVMSMTIEGAPIQLDSRVKAAQLRQQQQQGAGIFPGAGAGVVISRPQVLAGAPGAGPAASSLAGPYRGVGGPPPLFMAPGMPQGMPPGMPPGMMQPPPGMMQPPPGMMMPPPGMMLPPPGMMMPPPGMMLPPPGMMLPPGMMMPPPHQPHQPQQNKRQ